MGAIFQLVLLLMIMGVAAAENGLDGGTLMFLHVWKCGGTTLRELMCDWADREGLPCATVAGCRSLSLQVLVGRRSCAHTYVVVVKHCSLRFFVQQWLVRHKISK